MTRAAAAATGLRAGTPVVAGGGDQAANAVGVGAVGAGRRRAVARARRASCSPRPTRRSSSRAAGSTRSATPCPGRWHLMSVMLSAAGSLRWFRDALAPGVAFDELVDDGGDVAGRQRRAAVPALPHRRAQPAPGPAGARRVRRLTVAPRAAAPDAGRAGGRGVRAAGRPGPDDRRRHARPEPDPGVGRRHRERRSGGRSSPTSSAAEIATVSTTEGAAYGAALLAAVGAGWFRDVDGAADALGRRDAVGAPGTGRGRLRRGPRGLPGAVSGARADVPRAADRGGGDRARDAVSWSSLRGPSRRPRRASCP